MAVRSNAMAIIAKVRKMIGDPAGGSEQFSDQEIQDKLDEFREDIRYLSLDIAPSIVNSASTGNIAEIIFADFYSTGFQWWEDNPVLQGQTSNGAAWKVLTPLAAEPLVGHWQFELDVFNSGTVPGQLPPVFITGYVHDPNMAAADLLEIWAVSLSGAYDITVDGQSLRRSQLMTAKYAAAEYYRKRAKPRVARMVRGDVQPTADTVGVRLLDSVDIVKGW